MHHSIQNISIVLIQLKLFCRRFHEESIKIYLYHTQEICYQKIKTQQAYKGHSQLSIARNFDKSTKEPIIFNAPKKNDFHLPNSIVE
jgi:hypothetical protein